MQKLLAILFSLVVSSAGAMTVYNGDTVPHLLSVNFNVGGQSLSGLGNGYIIAIEPCQSLVVHCVDLTVQDCSAGVQGPFADSVDPETTVYIYLDTVNHGEWLDQNDSFQPYGNISPPGDWLVLNQMMGTSPSLSSPEYAPMARTPSKAKPMDANSGTYVSGAVQVYGESHLNFFIQAFFWGVLACIPIMAMWVIKAGLRGDYNVD